MNESDRPEYVIDSATLMPNEEYECVTTNGEPRPTFGPRPRLPLRLTLDMRVNEVAAQAFIAFMESQGVSNARAVILRR